MSLNQGSKQKPFAWYVACGLEYLNIYYRWKPKLSIFENSATLLIMSFWYDFFKMYSDKEIGNLFF